VLGMQDISTEVTLYHSIQRVWEILTGFKNYPGWNPVFKEAKGVFKRGRRFFLQIHFNEQLRRNVRWRISKLDPYQEFRLHEKKIFRWLYESELIFNLQFINESEIKLVLRKKYQGLLAEKRMRKEKEPWLEAMRMFSQALKTAVEGKSKVTC
jgi:hypothetical protein